MTVDEFMAKDPETLSAEELSDLAKAWVKEEKSSATSLTWVSAIAALIFCVPFFFAEANHLTLLQVILMIPLALFAYMGVQGVEDIVDLRKTKKLLDSDPDGENAKQFILQSREKIKKRKEYMKKDSRK